MGFPVRTPGQPYPLVPPVHVLTPTQGSQRPSPSSFSTLNRAYSDDQRHRTRGAATRALPVRTPSYSTSSPFNLPTASVGERSFPSHLRQPIGDDYGRQRPRPTFKHKRRVSVPSSDGCFAQLIRLIKLLFCCCCCSK